MHITNMNEKKKPKKTELCITFGSNANIKSDLATLKTGNLFPFKYCFLNALKNPCCLQIYVCTIPGLDMSIGRAYFAL